MKTNRILQLQFQYITKFIFLNQNTDMKMVILGAQAPKCDRRPQNPTSSAHVGTMQGQQVRAKTGDRSSATAAGHRPAYQGLLQAPRLSEIFDHQLIKTNFTNGPNMKGGYPQQQQSMADSLPLVGQPNDYCLATGTLQAQAKDLAVSGARGKNSKSTHRYHYQKFSSQSMTSFGGPGLRPGQKSIKQQRDLAQLRFYQTLTNQPHLISQQLGQGQSQAQVKMLGDMRLGQGQQARQQESANQPRDADPQVADHVQEALQSLERAHQGVTRQYRLKSNAGTREFPQGEPYPSDLHEMEKESVSQGSMQMRAKTSQNLEPGHHGQGQVAVQQPAVGADGIQGSSRVGYGDTLKQASSAVQEGEVAGIDQIAVQQEIGNEAVNIGLTPGQVAAGRPNGPADLQNELEGVGGGTDPVSNGLPEQMVPSHPQGVKGKADENGYGERAERVPSARQARQNLAVQAQTSSGTIHFQTNTNRLSDVLNAPVMIPGARRDPVQKKSIGTAKIDDSGRNSQAVAANSPARASTFGPKDGAGVHSLSSLPRNGNQALSRSRERDGKPSPTRRSKQGPISVAKIQRVEKMRSGGVDEEQPQKLDRFSSQGQEELVQSYQLPAYGSTEGRAGFPTMHSQHLAKRNYTSYGGPRASAAAEVAARNQEYLQQSMSAAYKTGGVGMAATSAMSGMKQARTTAAPLLLSQKGFSTQESQHSKSKGALGNFLVKTCSFQARQEVNQKRDLIRTAYTITRAGPQGLGVLPQIGHKASLHEQQDAVMQTGANSELGLIGKAEDRSHEGQQQNEYGFTQSKPELQSKRGVFERLSAPAHCKRFMERGNKPVPTHLEEHDSGKAQDEDQSKATDAALVPYVGGGVPDMGETAAAELAAARQRMSQQSGRQVVYGNLQLGHFEEEISGINLSKLFSVYGPQSAEGRRRKKLRHSYQTAGEQQHKGQDIAGLSVPKGLEGRQFPQRQGTVHTQALQLQSEHQSTTRNQAPMAEEVNFSSAMGVAGLSNPNGPFAGRLAGDRYADSILEGQARPLSQGKSPHSAGNHHDLGSRDQARADLPQAFSGMDSNAKGGYIDAQRLSDDESESEDEEEPLIIQLMESMFTRKKTVHESEQMISAISVSDIRAEIRRLALKEKCRRAAAEREKVFEQRMTECERLNERIQQDNQEYSQSVFEKPSQTTRENPFYLALKAQKEERDRYKQMLQLAITADRSEAESEDVTGDAQDEEPLKQQEDGANDIFKHTFVDILEEDKSKDAAQPTSGPIAGNSDKERRTALQPAQGSPKEIFYFYNFSFDLPTEYYKQLGDFSVVNRTQAQKIREFMIGQWPILRGKKVQFKVAFDQSKEVYNVVLLGKDCPLSKCCKMTVYFQFTKDIGGKVICMENLCALNPLDHFFIELDLVRTLFYEYPLGKQQESVEQGRPGEGPIATKRSVVNEMMSVAQYKKLKPTFKKLISQEISKMVSKGTHLSLSIRDVIKNQNLEEKARDQMTAGRALERHRPLDPPPKKMTQSKLLQLLYDTSSQESSQMSYLGAANNLTEFGEMAQLNAGSQMQPANEDLMYDGDNQAHFGRGESQIVVSPLPQDLAGHQGEQEHYDHQKQIQQPLCDSNGNLQCTQISMDDLLLAAQAAERGEQPAILFSHAAQAGRDSAEMSNDMTSSVQNQNLTDVNDSINLERRIMNNSHQAPGNAANQGPAAGTFNPSPLIIVKPKLENKENLEVAAVPVSETTEKVKVDDQQPRLAQEGNEAASKAEETAASQQV